MTSNLPTKTGRFFDVENTLVSKTAPFFGLVSKTDPFFDAEKTLVSKTGPFFAPAGVPHA